MKKLFRCAMLAAMSCAALLFLSSCLPSDIPLSNENNYRDARLVGSWVKEKRKTNGASKKDVIRITEQDNYYLLQTESENNPFILTQLESYFFMSYRTKEGGYLILRIEFDDTELRFFGFTEVGMKQAEKEVFDKDDGQKVHTKISQAELRKWCIKHAGDFSSEPAVYHKEKPLQE